MIEHRTILLVEDDEDDIFIMQRALKEAVITNPLQVVQDGEKAIAYLAGQQEFSDRSKFPLPVIIFLDLNLPLRSGFDVLSWMRQREQFASIIVVVLTSSEEPQDLSRAYRLGANSYLVKPPTPEELLDMAKAFRWYWIEHKELAPSVPDAPEAPQ
jgi:CheY-like chemotaxis protein